MVLDVSKGRQEGEAGHGNGELLTRNRSPWAALLRSQHISTIYKIY